MTEFLAPSTISDDLHVVLPERRGSIATSTLNRPTTCKAFNAELRKRVLAVIRECESSENPQGLEFVCVVIGSKVPRHTFCREVGGIR
jgi:enoyl-CoA hydratase/carnithine racemase